MSGLQCPHCGHVHPMEEVGSAEIFRCRGCRGLLSVPVVPARAVFGGASAAGRVAPPPSPATTAPRVPPAPVRPSANGAATTGRAPGPPAVAPAPPTPAWVRAVVWVVALAAGLVAAVLPLRAAGLIDVDSAIDAFAGDGVARFAVLALLLPLWAGLSATMAHLVIERVAARRTRRARRVEARTTRRTPA